SGNRSGTANTTLLTVCDLLASPPSAPIPHTHPRTHRRLRRLFRRPSGLNGNSQEQRTKISPPDSSVPFLAVFAMKSATSHNPPKRMMTTQSMTRPPLAYVSSIGCAKYSANSTRLRREQPGNHLHGGKRCAAIAREVPLLHQLYEAPSLRKERRVFCAPSPSALRGVFHTPRAEFFQQHLLRCDSEKRAQKRAVV